jgi:hypothetical protein
MGVGEGTISQYEYFFLPEKGLHGFKVDRYLVLENGTVIPYSLHLSNPFAIMAFKKKIAHPAA